MTEDEMVGWHQQLNGYEFEQALGVGDGQGGLACCSPWGCKEVDVTKRLTHFSWSLHSSSLEPQVLCFPPEVGSLWHLSLTETRITRVKNLTF